MPVLAHEVMTPKDHEQVLKPTRALWERILDGRVWRISRHEFPEGTTIQQVRSRATSFASYHRIKVRIRVEDSGDSILFQYVGPLTDGWR
jgi:hypothetical protein